MSTNPLQTSVSSSSSSSAAFSACFPLHSTPANLDLLSAPFPPSPPPPSCSSSAGSISYQASPMSNFFSSLLSGGHRTQASPPPQTAPPLQPVPAAASRPAFCLKRLQKERKELLSRPPENISMSEPKELFEWLVNIKGAEGTHYANEEFVLKFRFPERYPLDSPEVTFVGSPPIHPHVYSNGHICLSILYDGWSPALSVSSICLSLISMLSSCKRKERPDDDGAYVRMAGSHVSPKHMRWIFHDDTV
eukprot:GHVS01080464.1.p1 GENE.GHVS01080464.1~~GHVS01080464.1.p1  ORF type:complete len:248 (+),score=43.96 GHVS01080464.1:127-870(+)